MTARNPNYPNQDATTAGVTGANADTGQAQQSANEVADQTKQAASQVTGQAKDAAKSQLAARKDQTAQGLTVVSSAVHDMSDKLRQYDQTSSYAPYADQAANQVQRLAKYLHTHEVNQIVDEAEDWARRDPMLALGGAFVLGLLAARFLKSSGVQTRSSQRRSTRSAPANRTYDPYYRNPAYSATNRPTGRYEEDQYRPSGMEPKESQY